MHPRQASLISVAEAIITNTAKFAAGAPVLWKYVCPDTMQEFYLPKRMMTLRSPYSGKSFTTKPEKMTIQMLGNEIREQVAAPAAPAPKASKKAASDT